MYSNFPWAKGASSIKAEKLKEVVDNKLGQIEKFMGCINDIDGNGQPVTTITLSKCLGGHSANNNAYVQAAIMRDKLMQYSNGVGSFNVVINLYAFEQNVDNGVVQIYPPV
ncbi:MAG: hypothetical protein KKF44_03560 [Nanoarchaeota archaeon]|nr:hypothetical protein [Nanoarchaeota archaeon]